MTLPDLTADLSGLDADAWFDRIDALGEEHGHFERIGRHHSSLFIDAGRDLLVTFETVEAARRMPGAQPRGLDLAARHGWSLMAFLSEGETWFRDRAVWGTFDRLTDDGFFEDFGRVLFFGAGPSGYAAASLSVAAPGARVLLFRPQATLTPAIAGWDKRFPESRRRDFTSRYGYGPDMIDAARRVDIVADPMIAPDAIHAALYTRPNVTVHRAAWAGPRTEAAFDAMGLTPDLIAAAMAGDLSPASFGRLWRARRQNPAYLRILLKKLEVANRPGLIRHLCAHGLTTRDAALFERKLAEMRVTEAAE